MRLSPPSREAQQSWSQFHKEEKSEETKWQAKERLGLRVERRNGESWKRGSLEGLGQGDCE